jgi:hypothetical protein
MLCCVLNEMIRISLLFCSVVFIGVSKNRYNDYVENIDAPATIDLAVDFGSPKTASFVGPQAEFSLNTLTEDVSADAALKIFLLRCHLTRQHISSELIEGPSIAATRVNTLTRPWDFYWINVLLGCLYLKREISLSNTFFSRTFPHHLSADPSLFEGYYKVPYLRELL